MGGSDCSCYGISLILGRSRVSAAEIEIAAIISDPSQILEAASLQGFPLLLCCSAQDGNGEDEAAVVVLGKTKCGRKPSVGGKYT